MSCENLRAPSDQQNEAIGECSWSAIIEAIRLHAREQPPELASELAAWADLLEGISQLEDG